MTTHTDRVAIEPDWNEVLARSAAIVRRRRRRAVVTTLIVVALCAVAGPALAASGWLDAIFGGSPVSTAALSPGEVQALETMTARGAPMPLKLIESFPSARRATLERAGLTGIRRLGTTQGVSFYAFDFSNGRRCYDAVHQPKILGGIVRCFPTGGQEPFPSPHQPVFDLSMVGADMGQPMHTIDLEGIAADGVASVGVLGSDGNVYGKTSVVGNLFVSTELPPQADGPDIAYDSAGHTIWCFTYVPPRFPRGVLAAAGCPPEPRRPTGRWINPSVRKSP